MEMTRDECVKLVQAMWKYKDCGYSEHEIEKALDGILKEQKPIEKLEKIGRKKMIHSKTYKATWVLTWLTLQVARITTIASAGIIFISEMDVNKFNLGQMALIKFGAIIIGFIVVMGLNRIIEAVEYYCHEFDI